MRCWQAAVGTFMVWLLAAGVAAASGPSTTDAARTGAAASATGAAGTTSTAGSPGTASGTSAASATPATTDALGLPPIVDPSAPFVLMADIFVLVPQRGLVHVQELVTGANRSAAPVHGLTFTLPPGAAGVRPGTGIPPGALTADASSVHLQMDVPPGGDVHLAFIFDVPRLGGRVWLPVSYPTGELTAMVPHGRWAASAAGFSPAGTLRLSGNVAVDTYTTLTPSAGALLPLGLRALAWWNGTSAKVALGGAAVLLGAAALAAALRQRRAARARRESDLIDALAELDLAHQQGTLAEAPYRDRRQSLLDEWAAVHGA